MATMERQVATTTRVTQLRLTVVDALREIEELQCILLDDYEVVGSVSHAAGVAMNAVSEMATHVLAGAEVGSIEVMVELEERPSAKDVAKYGDDLHFIREVSQVQWAGYGGCSPLHGPLEPDQAPSLC